MTATLTERDVQTIADSATLRSWADMLVADLRDGTPIDRNFLLALAADLKAVAKRLFDSVGGDDE